MTNWCQWFPRRLRVVVVVAAVVVVIEGHLIGHRPSLQRSTRCQTVRAVRMSTVVGPSAQLVDGAQPGDRRQSRAHPAVPSLTGPPDGSVHYVPRFVHPPYWVVATRDDSQGYKTV